MDKQYIILLISFLGFGFFTACVEETPEPNPPSTFGEININWDSLNYNPTAHELEIPITLPSPLPMPSDNPLTEEGIALGRKLFYDKTLSIDRSVACASCHLQSASFTDEKQFSIGVNNAIGTRNAMALVNLAWAESFFWDGSALGLEEQALEPVPNPVEMHLPWDSLVQRLNNNRPYRIEFYEAFGTQTITPDFVTKALAQFERTLISGDSYYDLAITNGSGVFLNDQQQLGYDIFTSERADCFHCHGPVKTANLFTTNEFVNNGLDFAENLADVTDKGLGAITGREEDNGKFKIPTLRNVALTAPYMHDGRFATLEEVVEHYNSGVKRSPNLDVNIDIRFFGPNGQQGLELTQEEKDALVAFLETLTDTTFLNNPKFADPF